MDWQKSLTLQICVLAQSYPKGDNDYSSQTAGALWTMFCPNGQEDLDFRLLHVYYSPKRAGTQCKKTSHDPNDEMKRKRLSTIQTEPPLSMSSLPSSPVPPLVTLPSLSKESEEFLSAAATEIDYLGNNFLRNDQPLLTFSDSFNEELVENNEPFRNENSSRNLESPLTLVKVTNKGGADSSMPNRVYSSSRRHPMQRDVFNSSEINIHPSLIEFPTCWLEFDKNKASTPEERAKNFAIALEKIHYNLKERIKESPQAKQSSFLNLLASWAKRVAQDPLNLAWYEKVEHKNDFDAAAV